MDRNSILLYLSQPAVGSPSTRRAWIEILARMPCNALVYASPSTRRAWIEICTDFSSLAACLSPSTRRAWIEISRVPAHFRGRGVALHPEGVDRNFKKIVDCDMFGVALHPEGVDRNQRLPKVARVVLAVALHPEGVDRNTSAKNPLSTPPKVALHPEGVDRNSTSRP